MPQDILFEPDDYLLHLIPVEITHFCPTQSKRSFSKGGGWKVWDAAFTWSWQTTVARLSPASLLNHPHPFARLSAFFLGDSQSVTVPGRKQLTSGTEFVLFYFSISQKPFLFSVSRNEDIKTIPVPAGIHVNIIIVRDKMLWHFRNNINGDLQVKKEIKKKSKEQKEDRSWALSSTFITVQLMERWLGENVNYRFTGFDRKRI